MRDDDIMAMALGARLQMRYGIGPANELLAIRRGQDPVAPLVSLPEALRTLARLAAASVRMTEGARGAAWAQFAWTPR